MSREIDLKIARDVMEFDSFHWDEKDNIVQVRRPGSEGWEIFHPTESIALAWQVIEKLTELNIWLDIQRRPDGVNTAAWSNTDRVVAPLLCTGSAETAPLAICQIALAAIERLHATKQEL